MSKNNKRKIIIALVVAVGILVASIFGMDAFADEIKIPTNAEFSIHEVILDKDTKQFKADIRVEDKLKAFNGLNFVISTSTKGFVNIKDITYNIENKSDIITKREYVNGNQNLGFLDINNRHNEVNATVTFEYTNEYTDDTEAIITLERVEVLYLEKGKITKNTLLPKDVISATRIEKYEPEKQQTIEIIVKNRTGEKKIVKSEVKVLKEENIHNILNGTEQIQGIIQQLGKNLEGAKVTNETIYEGNEFISIDLKNKIDVVVDGKTLKLEKIAYDKAEKMFIPIYSPTNNFEEAIRTDFKHNVDFITVFHRYREVSLQEAYCVLLETKDTGASCSDFDGLRHDKPPFSNFNFVKMAIMREYRIGTRFDVLKERWGIDDNYIKYDLEPNRMSGIPNQEEMDWNYSFYK